MKVTRVFALAATAAGLVAAPAQAWNAHGHRTVTLLALDGLAPDTPSFLKEAGVAARIAEQSNEPDRWRGTRATAINAGPNLDHYIDVEDLEQFGLKLGQLPRPRYEYLRTMAAAKAEHPEKFPPYDAVRDPDRSKEFPGFLPHAIDEHFAKLESSFNTLRILEALKDPAREAQLAQARENVVYEMGILSHYVADAAQPLHTTRHHHGWVGENPGGYTTENGFHSYIDGRVLEIHKLDYESLKGRVKFGAAPKPGEVWPQSLAYIQRSFDQVEPLYKMQKDGGLTKEAGKEEISARLCDGAEFLAALYNAAWAASKPTDGEVSSFVKYSELKLSK